ncbi:S53 family peptidase [Candidatus Gottesmanbacteria bacterium]|nr:S53 family peptidase [Candidatus Gottesmanbacteria bacterium]
MKFLKPKYIFSFIVISFLLLLGITTSHPSSAQGHSQSEEHRPVCPGPASPGDTRCHARVITDQNGNPKVTTLPVGYGPKQFLGAYNLSGQAGGNPIVAIVDAYDHPNILNDLNKYSSTFGISSLPACLGPIATSSGACFQKVDQSGGTSFPTVNSGWALEIALDVEASHAVCQNCKILLVEANSNSYSNLMTAVDRARALGATAISNSYGSGEFSGETSFDSHFNFPGLAITFSSGDGGYGPEYPAASQYVTAVGGTSLQLNGDNSWKSETTWSGAGSGCSSFEGKPGWQHDSSCSNRTIADVSADADPNTGAAVYDSVRYQGRQGWFKVGGTSLSSPIVAAVYALSGNTAGAANSIPYSNPASLHDITSGSNGSCGGNYLCTAVSGYDGPTGLGTPNGIGAF